MRFIAGKAINNIQVWTSLSKEIVKTIDREAGKNFRKRAEQVRFIIYSWYKRNKYKGDS